MLEKYGGAVPRYTSYPTAPHFHGGVDHRSYAEWLSALPEDAGLSLYVHVPFCDTLCWFCGCHTKVVRRYEPVASYLEFLRKEIAFVAARSGSRRVRRLHFGGGSPTILAPADFLALMGDLRAAFDFDPDADIAIEVDPRDLTPCKVSALASAGVTRASIGMQDIDPEVQKAINRIQPQSVTKAAVDSLRRAGVGSINIDVMYGLPHQNLRRVIATVDAAARLGPDRLALFGYAHVPWMKRHQQLIDETALPDPPERLAEAQAAAACLKSAGYRQIGLDHFARPNDALALAEGRGALRRNFQGYTEDAQPILIGFGPSAIGSLPQGYVQNTPDMPAYRKALEAGRNAVYRGVELSAEDSLRRDVIERLMCDLRADTAALCANHGVRDDHFEPEFGVLQQMERDGLVELDGRVVKIPEAARSFMRNVAAVFDAHLNRGLARHSQAV